MEDTGVLSRDEQEELLPGIVEDVTINHIATKLPWTDFHTLSHVSRGWRRAIQSHAVYDARVRSNLTQTLIAFGNWVPDGSGDYRLVLYSVSDNKCYHLPRIAGFRARQMTYPCECVSLDGKLYVMGGYNRETGYMLKSTSNLHVFDLPGQRQWKQCASMANVREQFACFVKDGKIYVFGGNSESLPEPRGCLSEVYQPKEDVWSPITPMPSWRKSHEVTVVGEELFVMKGSKKMERTFEWGYDSDSSDDFLYATSADVYHPLQERWRTVEHFSRNLLDRVCKVRGKSHRLNGEGIQGYDIRTNSWGPKRPLSFGDPEPNHLVFDVCTAVSLDDEILAIVRWGDDVDGTSGTCLVKTQGVAEENTEVVFQKLECPFPVDDHTHLMCTVEV